LVQKCFEEMVCLTDGFDVNGAEALHSVNQLSKFVLKN
jgi:hypothetical protein